MKLAIKTFKQTPGYCGPTSVRIVLNFYDVKISEKELAKIIGATKKDGCTPKQIISGLKKIGFEASYKKNSSILKLEKLISKNIPVIVYWSPRGYGHYSIVMGVDKKHVFIADPKSQKILNFKRTDFLEKWFDADSPKDKREIIAIRHP